MRRKKRYLIVQLSDKTSVGEENFHSLTHVWSFSHLMLCMINTPGGGVTPLQRVWFVGLLSLKTGIHFAHFGLESGMVFEGTKGEYESVYRFNSK